MGSNFFDDVFDNKIFFEKKDLYKKVYVKDVIEEDDVYENSKVLEKVEIEDLLEEAKTNPFRIFSKEEIMSINKSLDVKRQEITDTVRLIRSERKFYSDVIRKSNKSFDLDISKNSEMKRLMRFVFGKETNTLTYEDYLTLLEMKRIMDVKEKKDLLEEGIFK